MTGKGEQYTCACCRGTFDKGWSDEEALAEFEKNMADPMWRLSNLYKILIKGDGDEEGLVVWKMSRFAREILDAQFFRADLRRRGYKVISVNDPV